MVDFDVGSFIKDPHHTTVDFDLLDFEQAQTLVLGNNLSGLVAVLVNRESVGVKPKLFGYLKRGE